MERNVNENINHMNILISVAFVVTRRRQREETGVLAALPGV